MEIKGPKDVFAGIAGGILLILLGVWGLVWLMPRYELINAPDSLIPIASIFNIGLGFVWLRKGITGAIKLTEGKKELEIELKKEKAFQLVIQNKHAMCFYQTTLSAWSSGKLARLGKSYKTEAEEMQLEDFIKKYPPNDGTSLRAFFKDFQSLEGEFLVGMSDDWFVLTNIRLYQRDGRKNEYKVITLADIDTYKIKGKWTGTLVFKMKSGQEIFIKKTQEFPSQEFIYELASQGMVT